VRVPHLSLACSRHSSDLGELRNLGSKDKELGGCARGFLNCQRVSVVEIGLVEIGRIEQSYISDSRYLDN
jgi:hypothetical protein